MRNKTSSRGHHADRKGDAPQGGKQVVFEVALDANKAPDRSAVEECSRFESPREHADQRGKVKRMGRRVAPARTGRRRS